MYLKTTLHYQTNISVFFHLCIPTDLDLSLYFPSKMLHFSIIFSFLFALVYASSGDRDDMFQQCLEQCSCTTTASDKNYWIYPPWDCYDICEYKCMHEITNLRNKHGYPTLKYYGHWPFVRYYGLEEPASVVFSSANAIPHIMQFVIRSSSAVSSSHSLHTSTSSNMSRWLWLYSLSGTIAWILSAMFHTRKTAFTTMLDYISALIFLCLSLWISFYRIFGRVVGKVVSVIIFCFGFVMLLSRIVAMVKYPLDFGFHMNICISISVIQTIFWLYWALFAKDRKTITTFQKGICVLVQVWFSAAAALEIFDFPPLWGILDAHSLWHFATIPLGFIWYHFWALDCVCELKDEGVQKDM